MNDQIKHLSGELYWMNWFLFIFFMLGIPVLFYIITLHISPIWKTFVFVIMFLIGGGLFQAKREAIEELAIEKYKHKNKSRNKN